MRIFSSADTAGASVVGCPSALVLPALCRTRISASSSLTDVYDEPEILPSEIPQPVSSALTANMPLPDSTLRDRDLYWDLPRI
jgi:hypothetical protein